MEALGKYRTLIILILVIVNGLAAAGYYLYLEPENQKKAGELTSINGQIATMRTDLDKMRLDFEQFETQKTLFDDLKGKIGFFNTQDRRKAAEIFEEIQQKSGVISAKGKFLEVKAIEDAEAMKANHVIFETPLEITIEALEDTDIFRYIYLVQNYFPGHFSLEKIDLVRKQDLSRDVLKSIANKKDPVLVTADIKMVWRTMVPAPPKEEMQQQSAGG